MGFGSFLSNLDPTKKNSWTSNALAKVDPTNANTLVGKVVSSDIGKGLISGAAMFAGVPPSVTFAGLKGLQSLGESNKAQADQKRYNDAVNQAIKDTAKVSAPALSIPNNDITAFVVDANAGIQTTAMSKKPNGITNSYTTNAIDWKGIGKDVIGKVVGSVDKELSKDKNYKDVKDSITANTLKDMLMKFWYIPAGLLLGIGILAAKAFSSKKR